MLTWMVTPGRLDGMEIPPIDDGRLNDRLMSMLVGSVKLCGIEMSSACTGVATGGGVADIIASGRRVGVWLAGNYGPWVR